MAASKRRGRKRGILLVEVFPAVVLFLVAAGGVYRFTGAGEGYVAKLDAAFREHLEEANRLMSSGNPRP